MWTGYNYNKSNGKDTIYDMIYITRYGGFWKIELHIICISI